MTKKKKFVLMVGLVNRGGAKIAQLHSTFISEGYQETVTSEGWVRMEPEDEKKYLEKLFTDPDKRNYQIANVEKVEESVESIVIEGNPVEGNMNG